MLSFAPTSLAQATAGSAAQEVAPTLGELRDRIERRYQVLPIQDGVVLMPRYRTDVQSIELANGSIGIDGEPVTGAELTQRIGDDAEDITRLSFMDSTTRRVLFGIGPPPTGDVAADAAADMVTDAATTDDTAAEPSGEEDEPLDDEDHEGATFVSEEGDQVRVGGSVTVPAGRHVEGDVVAVGGSARVDGHVDGSVVAVGGSVRLGPNAVVEGEVTSVGGTIHRAPGAVVHGAVNEVAFGPNLDFHPRFGFSPMIGEIGGLIGTVLWIAFLAFIVSLAFLLARGPVERMEYRMATSAWKAAAVGLVSWLLFIPVLVMTTVILAISIIGIPLLLVIPFAMLALAIGILLGFVAVAKYIGHEAERRFGWDHTNPYLSILVGVGFLTVLTLFGGALGLIGGPFGIFGGIVTAIGLVIQFAAWTVGFGLFLLTRFGTRYSWDNGETPERPASEPVPAPSGFASTE
jgi:hypothetical protein